MDKNKRKEVMPVAAICNGIVIDHIPPEKLFKVASLLCLEEAKGPITIGNNFESRYLGKKGIIKLADQTISDEVLNRIALIAPNVHLSIIRDFEVLEKKPAILPEKILGLISCTNEKCITSNEPMPTRFIKLCGEEEGFFACGYCGRKIKADKIELL